ncbi:MAG: DeoR/GlpR family DNA-binding transcription regulator [Eubacteriales bacterium]|nr:DeoR/GlpR family DNA-binding transcription regulator [Eubacteriales bacterium]
MSNARQEKILQVLEQKGDVQLQKLKDLFPEVSVMTLRRDLITLENEGHVIRTYGGAVSTGKLSGVKGEEDAYTRRAAENVEAKMTIAEKALRLMEPGRSIYLDAGSTIMCLARMVEDESYSIITSGVNIALELIKKNKISAVALGGQLNRNTLSMSGPNAMAFLDTVNIDLAFMSASGFSLDNGFTVSNIYEGEIKRKVIARAKQVVALVDSSKVNKDLAFTYAYLKDIDIWICDNALSSDIMREAKKYKTEIW